MGASPSGSAANTHSVPFYFLGFCFVNRGVCLSAERSAASYQDKHTPRSQSGL